MTLSADLPYEALYVEHEPAARRLALSLVPPHAADDVVAEAFARVLDTAGRNGPPAAFRPYLMAAVRNVARTYHARGARFVPVPAPEPPPVTGPLRALVERDDARLAAQAFAALPERWQRVLWATAVEEITVAALAGRWGMTANSVSQLASRAREGLRQAYLNAHLSSVMPAGCRAVAKYMGASVRGRAARRHQAELAAHLSGCARCRQAHEGLAAMNHHLGGLIGPGAAGAGLLAHVLPAARAAGRWHLHPLALAAAASAVAVSGLVAVPYVTHTGGPAPARARAVVSSPGHDRARVTASAPPVSAARGRPSADVAGVPAPATSAGTSTAVPAATSGTAAPSGTAPAPSGREGSGSGGPVQQVLSGSGPATRQVHRDVRAAASAVAGTGAQAGGVVQAVGGTAGQVVQQVTGAAGGLLGGL